MARAVAGSGARTDANEVTSGSVSSSLGGGGSREAGGVDGREGEGQSVRRPATKATDPLTCPGSRGWMTPFHLWSRRKAGISSRVG